MESNYQYFSVAMSADPKVAFIEQLPGLGKAYLLKEGVTLAGKIPRDLVFDVADDEQGMMLTDFLNNISSNIFISEATKALFERLGLKGPQVEYYPFNVRNQRGRVESDRRYYIVNILSVVSCLDLDDAVYKIHPKKGTVWRIKKIAIDESKVPDNKLFRLGEDPTIIIFRSDLVETIEKEKLTGLQLCPVGKVLV